MKLSVLRLRSHDSTGCRGQQFIPRGIPRREFFRLAAVGSLGLAVLLELAGIAAAGYGRCSMCPCANYIQVPYTEMCQRCGHSYSAHW